MSNKIFDYINKLGKKKSDDSLVNLLQVPDDSGKRKRNLIPILISIVIFLSLILTGILVLQYYPQTISLLDKTTKPLTSNLKTNQQVENPANQSALVSQEQKEDNKVSNSNNATNNIITQNEIKNQSSQNENITAQEKENKNKIKNIEKEVDNTQLDTTSNTPIKREENVKNVIRLSENDLFQLQNEKEARRKRLLHQAENYRNKGDYSSAMNLYRIVWDEYKDPDAANNLGAMLIMMQKYDDAKMILDEAKKIKPDDPDINYNLNILEGIQSVR